MADTVDRATRSRIMSRIRGKNTGPELHLRKRLHTLGVRYRIHDSTISGKPDISHKGAKVAVFIDGCFWHGCPEHYSRPAARQEFWDAKLASNRKRRARVLQDLEGWTIVQAWECKVNASPAKQARIVAKVIRAAKG